MNDTTFPYLITNRSAMVRIGKTLYQADASHPSWDKIVNALRADEHQSARLRKLMDPSFAITKKGGGAITIVGGTVKFKGRKVPSSLGQKLLAVLDERDDLLPWLMFANKVMANPLASAREELHLFLTEAKLPITLDGDILAYKKVNSNYTSCHDGVTRYDIGTVTWMDRDRVDPDRTNTCSVGLHFASRSYLASFTGDRLITVKVNPADVIAIPDDYNNAKGRTWRMETVGELHIPTPWVTDEPDETLYAEPDPQGTQADGMEAIEVTTATLRNPAVVTKATGILTKVDLIAHRKTHGSWADVARHFGVSSGTVSAWVTKLGLVTKPRKDA